MTTPETSAVDLKLYDLHHAQPVLPVRDVPASVAWYRDALGFTVDFLWGEPAEHARVYAVEQKAAVAIQLTQVAEGADASRAGWIMIHVGAKINDLYEEYRSRGVTIAREIGERPWGMIDFDILDPDGNRIRFAGEAGGGGEV